MRRAAQTMHYSEYQPCTGLRPYVVAYWHFRVSAEVGAIEHCVPLTGGLLLVVNLRHGAARLFGPRLAPLATRVVGGDSYWGVHFWPGSGPALLGPQTLGLREGSLPAVSLLGAEAVARLVDELTAARGPASATRALDRALGGRLRSVAPLDPLVMAAVLRIVASGGRTPVRRLAAESGLSPRQLRRRFRKAVELTPKELARLRRVRGSAASAAVSTAERWIDIAAEHGYSDQAHLGREFAALLGLPPGAFARHASRIDHGPLVADPRG